MEEEVKPLGNLSVHASSNKQDWTTPQWLYNELHEEFDFTIDVCADSTNTKNRRYFDEVACGLRSPWKDERCFCNPPYKFTALWVEKAFNETHKPDGAELAVLLIPARPDTRYWHNWIFQTPLDQKFADLSELSPQIEVRFLKGRLKFGDSKNSAPFPSCVIVFYNKHYAMQTDKAQ